MLRFSPKKPAILISSVELSSLEHDIEARYLQAFSIRGVIFTAKEDFTSPCTFSFRS